MKRLKRASKAAVSLWLSAVMTVLPAAGGMISPAYGMELTDNTGVADTGSFDGYEAAAGGSAEAGGAGSEVEAGPEQGAAGGRSRGRKRENRTVPARKWGVRTKPARSRALRTVLSRTRDMRTAAVRSRKLKKCA